MMESHQVSKQETEPPLSPAFITPDHYCIDCGVTFESNTSLQVHLTYHKENLLTRWGPARQGHVAPTTSTRTATTTSTVVTIMEPKSEHPTPTASPHFTTQSQQFSQNYSPFGQTLHFLPPQQNQFSPNQYDEARIGQRIVKERNSADTPAEILDLDSNRVHLYNIQQEQNFYRPYLMSHPPPPLPAVPNGVWPQGVPPDLYHPPTFHPQDIYARNLNPPPQNVIYNYGQPESNYPPAQTVLPEQVPMGFQGQQQQPTQQSQPSQLQQSNVNVPSPGVPPKTPSEKKQKKSEGGMDMRGKGKGGECKRPKSYECTSCNKWFTSSGHLKRHYGTALHKNSAQQNGSEGTEAVIGPGRGKGKRKSKKDKKINLSDSNSSEHMDMPGPISPPRRFTTMTTITVDDSKSQNLGNVENEPQEEPQIQPPPPPPIHTIQAHTSSATPPEQPTYLYVGDPQFLGHPHHHSHFTTHHFDPALLYSQHPPSIYNNNSGYPTMEVPLPPFSSVTLSHYAPEPPSYHEQNGNNGVYSQEPRTTPPLDITTLKKEPVDESPEVGRGSGVSPHSSTSWLSPPQVSPENSNSHSSSSGNDSLESIGELPIASLDEAFSTVDTKTQLIKCPNCSKTFSRSCYLTQHKNSSHSVEGRPFRCPLCGKKFHLEPALSDHVAKHGGNKPYKCQLCPKEFNHKTDLRRHFCLHTGQKPFICRDCGKGFIRKDHMTKHAEIHRKGYRSSTMTLSPSPME